MTDDFTKGLEGQRASVVVEGESRTGTISSVTFTPKRGDVVVAVSLDEPTPSGRAEVAVGLDEVDTEAA